MTITNIDDARFLKRGGLPLNTAVQHRTFSEEYSEHWVRLMQAHSKFMGAVLDYTEHSGSPRKWKGVKRRLRALWKEGKRCDAFIGKRLGITGPREALSEDEERETLVLVQFLSERAVPFLEFWDGVIDEVEGGTALTIRFPDDVPPWCDAD
jgi:hypothetical protein